MVRRGCLTGSCEPGVPVERERARRRERAIPSLKGDRRRRSSGVGPSSSAAEGMRALCWQPPWQGARRGCARQGGFSLLRGSVDGGCAWLEERSFASVR